MNKRVKFLKLFLASVLLLSHLMMTIPVTAQSYETEPYPTELFDNESDHVLETEAEQSESIDPSTIESFDASEDIAIPAISGFVPEMRFSDDMLLEVEETEMYLPIEPRNVPAVGSGVVQFVLEPVQSSLPSGVSMSQARAAAFNARTMYHPLFINQTTNSLATAVNGRYGRDAIYLGQSSNGNRFRIMIAGFEGYVNRVGPRNSCGPQDNQACMITVPIDGVNRTFEVTRNAVFVPFNNYPSAGSGSVRSVSHYVNRNGELFRYLTNNAGSTGGFVRFLTGPAPSWMSQNTRYYSFDGIFFYRNPRNIRANGSGAVNGNNPHFNYFQYLSFRAPSTVTAAQLNAFLSNQSNHGINTSNSVMLNQGNAFINAQNRYGTNALLMYAKAMHESAGGTSAIARNNNNLFGQGAIDAAPGTNAWQFATPADSVNDLANGWLSRGYLWPGDWRYEGPHTGHQGSGMNVRYATDPYWGQKIAGWAFRIDRSRPSGSRDLNREQIAIRRNTSSVAVTNAAGATLYTANPRGARYFPFLVTATASNNRLQIVTDPAIVNGATNRTARFNRANAVGFIPNSNVWLAGARSPSGGGSGGSSGGQVSNHQITTMRRTGVTRQSATFRAGPSSSYRNIGEISANTNVRITGRSGNFYRVVVSGETGWIRQSAVARTRPTAVVTTNNAHVREGRSTDRRSLTRVPTGQRLTIERRTGSWSRVTVNGHTGWIRNRDISTSGGARPGQTTANNVRVHSRPRSESSVRHTLPRGAHLMIRQRTSSSDGWTQVTIRHNGGTLNGWVRSNQVANQNHDRRFARNGNLRSGPGTGHSNLGTIPANSRVSIRARAGSWYRVRATVNGRTVDGWTYRDNLNRLPLPR